jgi:hypothetical protein
MLYQNLKDCNVVTKACRRGEALSLPWFGFLIIATLTGLGDAALAQVRFQ